MDAYVLTLGCLRDLMLAAAGEIHPGWTYRPLKQPELCIISGRHRSVLMLALVIPRCSLHIGDSADRTLPYTDLAPIANTLDTRIFRLVMQQRCVRRQHVETHT